MVEEKALQWEKRDYRLADIKDAFLVIAATSSSRVNEIIASNCKEQGILANIVDNPEKCDFIVQNLQIKEILVSAFH